MTPDDEAILASAARAAEQTIATLNDYLQRILTLATALIGGGFVVAKGDALPYWWGVSAMLILLAALVICVWGLHPRGGRFGRYEWDTIGRFKAFEARAIHRKTVAAGVASAALVAALFVGIAGVVVKGPPPGPIPLAN